MTGFDHAWQSHHLPTVRMQLLRGFQQKKPGFARERETLAQVYERTGSPARSREWCGVVYRITDALLAGLSLLNDAAAH